MAWLDVCRRVAVWRLAWRARRAGAGQVEQSITSLGLVGSFQPGFSWLAHGYRTDPRGMAVKPGPSRRGNSTDLGRVDLNGSVRPDRDNMDNPVDTDNQLYIATCVAASLEHVIQPYQRSVTSAHHAPICHVSMPCQHQSTDVCLIVIAVQWELATSCNQANRRLHVNGVVPFRRHVWRLWTIVSGDAATKRIAGEWPFSQCCQRWLKIAHSNLNIFN